MKTITKKELKKLKFEVTDTGFTLWGEDGRWILDGSTLLTDGHISFCNKHEDKVQVEVTESKNWYEFKEIRLVSPLTKN